MFLLSFTDKLLFYATAGLVIYFLAKTGAGYIMQAFNEALTQAEKAFPKTAETLRTISGATENFFKKIDVYIEKKKDLKVSFRAEISDKIDLFVRDKNSPVRDFEKVSSISFDKEDDIIFSPIELTKAGGRQKFSYSGLFGSSVYDTALAIMTLLDLFSREICNIKEDGENKYNCELQFELYCESGFRLEYWFSFLLAYSAKKSEYEGLHVGTKYPITLVSDCPFEIPVSEIDLDNQTFVFVKSNL